MSTSRPPQAAMPLCSELMSRPKKAFAVYRPERTTPGGPSRAGRGRQYCKLRWLLSPKPEFSKCIFELKMPRPVIWQRLTSTNSCHEPLLRAAQPRSCRGVGARCKVWHTDTDMAGIPFFAQGRHEKLTPKKAARAAQTPAQNPFFSLKNVFALKNGFVAKKSPPQKIAHAGEKKLGIAHKKRKTEAGQIGMKIGEFPPCTQNRSTAQTL